jgi:putative transposase
MARLPRLTVTDYPHHVILRGNNRQRIFGADADFRRMCDLLAEHAKAQGVEVHAYVLMDNHLHLLLTPRLERALPKMMQAVGRSYVRYFNDAHQRTGTLWEGRYRSTLIQTERYLLACMVYIDLNPVRAGMVAQPQDYVWSSHRHYVGHRHDAWITPPGLVWELGNTPFAREAAYANLVQAGISAAQHLDLTRSALRGWARGDGPFVAGLQQQTTRRASKGKPGRPLALPKDARDRDGGKAASQ